MDRRGRAVSRVSTRRRARTRTGGAVFRPRARQRQRCRLGCRLGRRRGERRDLTGGRARERGGADATRDPPASRTPRSSPRAARTGKPPRRSCASPPRRDRRTFAGDYSSRRRLRNTAERRPPWCANAPYISSSRGTDTTRGFRAHAIRCYAAALPVYQHDGAPSATIGSEGGTEGGASTRGSGSNASAESAERWSRATEHLHFALGRQVAHAGSILAAEEYFRRLLECARRQPAATQSTYLREYLYVARCAADAAAADEKTKLRLDRTDLHRTGSNRRRTRTSVCLFPSSTRATFACTSRMDTATPSRRPRAARRPRARRGPRRVGRAWRRTDWFPRVTGGRRDVVG